MVMLVENSSHFFEHSLLPVIITLVAAVLTRFRALRPGQWAAMDKLLLLWIGTNIGVVTLRGYAGAWGGAYFYLNFSLLLLFLQLVKPLFLRHIVRSICGLSSAIVLSFSLCFLIGVARFGRYFYETSLTQARAGAEICIVDSREWNAFIIAGTPATTPFGAECKSASVLGNTPHPFYVVTNDLVEDRGIYQSLLYAPEDEFVWKQLGNLLLIRLPDSYRCDAEQLRCRWNDGNLASCLRQDLYRNPLQNIVRRIIKGKNMMLFGVDYYRGHHYVIVRCEGNCPDEIILPLCQEKGRIVTSYILSPSGGCVRAAGTTRF